MSDEVFGYGIFLNDLVNTDSYVSAEFQDYTINEGHILSSVIFSQNSINRGMLSGIAVFCDYSINEAEISSDIVVFSDNSVNTGIINHAIFLDNSVNQGIVLSSAFFCGSSINNGSLSSTSIFTDYSQNSANGEAQDVCYISSNVINTGIINLSAAYIEQDGPLPNGYFLNQTKIIPEDYKVKTWEYNGVWFTYNSELQSNLANDVYNTSNNSAGLFAFKKGIKRNLLDIYIKNGPFSTGYYSNDVLLETYNSDFGLPERSKDDFLFYVYVNGYSFLANGAFSTGFYVEGTATEHTSLSTENPYSAQDNQLYYTYLSGIPVLADDLYGTTFYFKDGKIAESTINLTPRLNVINLWTVVEYGNILILNGAYSYGYYVNGVLSGTFVTPTSTLNSNLWLTYIDGMPQPLPHGYYTNGVYVSGVVTEETLHTPITAIDGQGLTYYVYNNGQPILAQGPFTNAYFNVGQLSGSFNFLQPTIDNPNIFCAFIDGSAINANGAYKSGVYINGSINNLYTNTEKQSVEDDTLFYRFIGGYPDYSVTTYWYSSSLSAESNIDWFNIYNWYSDAFLTDNSNHYYEASSTVFVLASPYTPQIYIDDERWIEPTNIVATGVNLSLLSNINKTITTNISCTVLTCRGNVILE